MKVSENSEYVNADVYKLKYILIKKRFDWSFNGIPHILVVAVVIMLVKFLGR